MNEFSIRNKISIKLSNLTMLAELIAVVFYFENSYRKIEKENYIQEKIDTDLIGNMRLATPPDLTCNLIKL